MTVQIWAGGSAQTLWTHLRSKPVNDNRNAFAPQPRTPDPFRPESREAAFRALLETSRAADRMLAEARDHTGATALACRALANRYHTQAVHLSQLAQTLPPEVTA